MFIGKLLLAETLVEFENTQRKNSLILVRFYLEHLAILRAKFAECREFMLFLVKIQLKMQNFEKLSIFS